MAKEINFDVEARDKLKAGVDALAFGYIERILIPFGLHHAFYTPL